MSEKKKTWGRRCIAAGFYFCLFLGFASRLGGQELPLKRDLPGTDSIVCPEILPGPEPSDEEAREATRLGTDGANENILGQPERARDLLQRAVGLDPTSASLAYQFGRILEDLGESDQAIEQFCRARDLRQPGEAIGDAGARLDALARAREPQLPEAALSHFSNGLLNVSLGNLPEALEAFDNAARAAPGWGDPVYNRGVIRIRLGEPELAVEDLQEYLDLQPEAEDAMLVSQRIGQLQIRPASSVSAGTALGLGLVLPGGGQFYSGRALSGLSVLALAGGAAAAGFLIEEVETQCVGTVPSGGCPPDRVISETTTKPYKTEGLVAAGVIAVIGAVEAYFKARGGGGSDDGEIMGVDVGKARILGPSVSSQGFRLNLNLVRVTF